VAHVRGFTIAWVRDATSRIDASPAAARGPIVTGGTALTTLAVADSGPG
jgi:hypothetical protein